MAEGVYLEFEMMVIGVCSRTDTDLMLYPSRLEIQKDVSKPDFFRNYNTMVVIGDSYEDAVKVCFMSFPTHVISILSPHISYPLTTHVISILSPHMLLTHTCQHIHCIKINTPSPHALSTHLHPLSTPHHQYTHLADTSSRHTPNQHTHPLTAHPHLTTAQQVSIGLEDDVVIDRTNTYHSPPS